MVDAFCGPGGLSLGFEQAGFMVAVGIESDASSAQTYRSNFPLAEVIEKDLRRRAHHVRGGRYVVLVSSPRGPAQAAARGDLSGSQGRGTVVAFPVPTRCLLVWAV